MFGFEMQLLGQGRSLSPTGLKILAKRRPGLPTNAMRVALKGLKGPNGSIPCLRSTLFGPFSP